MASQVVQQPPPVAIFPRNGVFRLHAGGHPGASPSSSPLNLPTVSMLGTQSPPIPSPAAAGSPSEPNRSFEFFTEEDNQRFIAAIDSCAFPPQCEALAARMGNKTPQQVNNYATLYVEAVNSRRQLARAQGKSTDIHLTAAEVYAFHGAAQAYADWRRQGQTSPAGRLSTESAASGAATADERDGGGRSKTSIEFLCGGSSPSPPRANHPPRPTHPHVLAVPPSFQFYGGGVGLPQFQRIAAQIPERSFLVEMLSQTRPHSTPPIKREAPAPKEGGGRQDGAEPERKRARSDETRMADVELADAQRALEDGLRHKIPHENIWAYSAMSQQLQIKEDDLKGKNPWEWSRKVIVKKEGGYAQWWPLFQDCVVLSKRETSDDMRLIKGKAPPAAPWHAHHEAAVPPPSSAAKAITADKPSLGARKTARGRAAVELKAPRGAHAEVEAPPARHAGGRGGGSKEAVAEWPRVGDAVEVKWDGDWWHATCKKSKYTWDKTKIEKVYVTYVGGTEDEDEWVPFSRIRAPREDAPAPAPAPVEEEEEGDDWWEEEEPEFRPNKPAAKGRGGARGARGGARGVRGKAKRGAGVSQ